MLAKYLISQKLGSRELRNFIRKIFFCLTRSDLWWTNIICVVLKRTMCRLNTNVMLFLVQKWTKNISLTWSKRTLLDLWPFTQNSSRSRSPCHFEPAGHQWLLFATMLTLVTTATRSSSVRFSWAISSLIFLRYSAVMF